MEIFEKQQKINAITQKYDDLIGNEAMQIANALALPPVEESIQTLKKLENNNRLLKIGIVGRVKAGKSSLINALLFDGKSILPKAATPMTAALTIISHGDDFGAEIEYYEEKDIENIKSLHAKYKSEEQRLFKINFEELKEKKENALKKKTANATLSPEDLEEIKELAQKKVSRKLKENTNLDASYDQYEKILKSNVTLDDLKNLEPYKASNLEELKSKLKDFVGAEGTYMPFTKSVHIKIPNEQLKDIQLIDTPGINDPVKSREERTRQLLQECDVTLVVSPSGQFLNTVDEELMDRITSKEGIHEIHVISSQIDSQLMGHIKEESNGDILKGLESLKSSLTEHMRSTMSKMKKNSPEIGNTFDQLINGDIVYSSGISHSIINQWDKKDDWDSGMTHVWENLKSNYPDYFSDLDKELSVQTLKKLSNIDTVNNIVESVSAKKSDILSKRKDEFINAKAHSIAEYLNELSKYISDTIEEINNGDVDELQKKRNELAKIKDEASFYLDETYSALIDDLKNNLNLVASSKLKSVFNDAQRATSSSEGSETRNFQVKDKWGLRNFFCTKTHTESETYAAVKTGAVRNILQTLTSDVEDTIESENGKSIAEWKALVPNQLIKTLRSHVDDEHIETHKIKIILRNVINTISLPELSYSGRLPDSLSASGTLTQDDATRFIAAAEEYIFDLQTRVRADIKGYITALVKKLKAVNISKEFFSDYDSMLEKLEAQIKNKAIIIDKFGRLDKELNEIK